MRFLFSCGPELATTRPFPGHARHCHDPAMAWLWPGQLSHGPRGHGPAMARPWPCHGQAIARPWPATCNPKLETKRSWKDEESNRDTHQQPSKKPKHPKRPKKQLEGRRGGARIDQAPKTPKASERTKGGKNRSNHPKNPKHAKYQTNQNIEKTNTSRRPCGPHTSQTFQR